MAQLMSDIVIVMERGERTFPVIGMVCGLDGIVHDQPQDGVIAATIPSQHVHALRASPGVSYVRQVHSYLCDGDVHVQEEQDN